MRLIVTWALLAAVVACARPPVEPYVFAPVPIAVPSVPDDVPASTTSTTPLELSVERATMLALENNRDLAVRSFEPVIAGTFERIERGVFDPELFARFRVERERASQVARATGERFDVLGTNTTAAVGVRQQLPTGTSVEVAVEHGFDESDRTPRQQVARLGLTVTQALLRGFGPAVNLAALHRAELELDASVHEIDAFAQMIVMNTEVAYWRFALARREIAIFTRSLEVAREQQNEVEQRIEVGLTPELEAAAARAEVARRKQQLIDAKSRLEAARLTLARLISGVALDRALNPTSPLRLEPQPVADVAGHVALALSTRPDLEEAAVRQEQNRLDTVVTRNGVLPRLDFFVALGKTGFDTSASGSFDALGSNTYDVVAGLELGDFLGHRASQAVDRAARASHRRAAEAVANLRQLVALDVRLAINEVERARAQIAATAVTRSLQEAAVEAERERFAVGAGTAILVATAQRDLLSAQIDEVRAIVDYRIARVQLYRAEGTLLARRGVAVTEP